LTSVFELDVSSAGTPGKYKVKVIQSPAGDASATFELDPAHFIDALDGLQQTLLASSVPSRRLLSRGEASVRDVGQRLFDALFSQQAVGGVYRASSAIAAERGEALRIVLRLTAPELAVLPWESMFDASNDSYVARREPLVRYVPVPSNPAPLKVRLPLKVLAPIASPRGLAALDVEKERDNLTQALQPLVQRGGVAVEWLEHATWEALQDSLMSDNWHVVHFIGHGDFDIERDEGVLALENEHGGIHRVPAANFVDLLREAQPTPRLVVLNACESSASGQTDLFSGTAAALVRGGISAVAAMQFEISDQAAIAFCRGFYTAIGRARGVDEAVRSGRVAIVGLGEGSLEWITPTLYLRGQQNHLFELSDSPPESTPELAVADQRSSAAAGDRDGRTPVPRDESMPAETPDDEAGRQGRDRALTATRPQATPADPDAPQEPDAPAQIYPDRLVDLWAVASRRRGYQPYKSDLEPLARALRPDEEIVGCINLPFTLWKSCAITVTDRNVHLSTSAPKSRPWAKLRKRLPRQYRPELDRVSVPLEEVISVETDVEHPKVAVLRLRAEDPLWLLSWDARSLLPLRQLVAEAQEIAGSRDLRGPRPPAGPEDDR
jgi:hypothetical protein